MQRKLLRNLMVAVALSAVLVGVILAVAPRDASHHSRRTASHEQHTPHSQTRLAAEYIGLSRSQLRRRLRAGQTLSEIAAGTARRSTSGLITALLAPLAAQLRSERLSTGKERTLLARLRARVLLEVSMRRASRGDIPAAAAKIGLSESELRSRLQHGATLAQIATSTKRISAADLIDALIAAKAQRLRLALRAKSISATQEKRASASLRVRVTREVNRKLLQSG